MNFISDFVYTWHNGNYLGPHHSNFLEAPINSLDSKARTHDRAYRRANQLRGRSILVAKAQADFALAGSSNNPIVKLGMYSQGLVRVLTFNSLPLPW
jgi:hypothetical protein